MAIYMDTRSPDNKWTAAVGQIPNFRSWLAALAIALQLDQQQELSNCIAYILELISIRCALFSTLHFACTSGGIG